MASLLRDPVRAVRIEAARASAGTDPLSLTPALQTALVLVGFVTRTVSREGQRVG